jgi:di/tricarboxylate transporter
MKMMIMCWLLLYFTLLRGAPSVANLAPMMKGEYDKLGRFTAGETITTLVFLGCVVTWVFSDFFGGLIGANIDDAVVAIVGALVLFLTPLDRKWDRTVRKSYPGAF